MSRKISLALLAGASCLFAAPSPAAAFEATAEPTVVYADQPAPPQPAPARPLYAERSNMGGGFIQFLFGEGQNQGERYQQQPSYQQQSSYQYRGPLLPQSQSQHMQPQQQDASDASQR